MADTPPAPRVGLFVTCLVDLYRPAVGFAAVKLLEDAGCTVEVPASQTCCGQPAFNAGDRKTAQDLARSTVAAFDHITDDAHWQKRLFCSADPGRPTNVHVRVDGWPGQQFALLFVDWMKGNPGVRAEYLDLKRRVSAQEHVTTGAYADAKEPWFLDAYRRAWEWADATGWRPGGPAQAGGGAG